MTRKTKKFKAKLAYLSGSSIDTIATKLDVPRSTVGYWIKSGEWREIRDSKVGVATRLYKAGVAVSILCAAFQEQTREIKQWLSLGLQPYDGPIKEVYKTPKEFREKKVEVDGLTEGVESAFRQWS